jgi:exonuclease VII small subunit
MPTMGLHRKFSGASASVLNLLSSKGDHHNGAGSPPRAQQHVERRQAVSDTEVFRENASSPDTLVEIPLSNIAAIPSATQPQQMPKRPLTFRRWSTKPSSKSERARLEEVVQRLEAENHELRTRNDTYQEHIATLENRCEELQRRTESQSQTVSISQRMNSF